MTTAARTLETPRLKLRPFTEADAAAYAAICADPEVMRHIGTGVVQTAAEAWRAMAMFLGHWQLRGFGMWALEHRARGVLLGRVGFHHPPDWPDFELGWLLGREHWGHGYAREAAARGAAAARGRPVATATRARLRPRPCTMPSNRWAGSA